MLKHVCGVSFNSTIYYLGHLITGPSVLTAKIIIPYFFFTKFLEKKLIKFRVKEVELGDI